MDEDDILELLLLPFLEDFDILDFLELLLLLPMVGT